MAKYDSNDNVERTLSYTYGYDHQRIRMVDSVGNSLYRAKTYVGSCEYNHDLDCERILT